jgi:hypothetical protein
MASDAAASPGGTFIARMRNGRRWASRCSVLDLRSVKQLQYILQRLALKLGSVLLGYVTDTIYVYVGP